MAKEIRIGTNGWVTSVENQDIKANVLTTEVPDWNSAQMSTTTLEFSPKADCVVVVNGYRSMVPAEAKYRTENKVFTFITETADIEYYLTMTF